MKRVRDRIKERIALLRIRQGDSEAFGFLYDSYAPHIYRYVFFKVSDAEVAQDITQDTFVQTWEYLSANKSPVRNLQSLIYKIAYNKIVDHYRFKERQASLISALETAMEPSANLSHAELELHFLMQHIRALKQEYQDVILLRHVEGLSIQEIAEVVSKEPNNVRVLLHRALQSLKNILDSLKKPH